MIKSLHFIALFSFVANVKAQSIAEQAPCITDQEYAIIENIVSNSNVAHQSNKTGGATPSLIWPVQAANGITDCGVYQVSAYVDHNVNVGQVQDFSCGTNTYDGHKGTDISTWPFNFIKMENDLAEVVAAAAGTIIAVHDGEFDRNCSSNQLTANYVIIEHSDGSRALYWHMKNGSVTTKAVNQTVLAGEHLGMVGSSGSSSGPHLHFEVWAGSTVDTRIDPFGGNCNSLNQTSWWAAQKPARETAVIKAGISTTDVVMAACPTTETSNETNSFTMPFQGAGLPAGYAKFYMYLRDETNGLTATMTIKNPNQSTFATWTYTSSANTGKKYFGWSKKLPTTAGVYTYEISYNNTVCSSTFEMIDPNQVSVLEMKNEISIFPNPSNGKFIVELDNFEGKTIAIYNLLGAKVMEQQITQNQTEINLGISGVYFYEIKENNSRLSTGKLVVK